MLLTSLFHWRETSVCYTRRADFFRRHSHSLKMKCNHSRQYCRSSGGCCTACLVLLLHLHPSGTEFSIPRLETTAFTKHIPFCPWDSAKKWPIALLLVTNAAVLRPPLGTQLATDQTGRTGSCSALHVLTTGEKPDSSASLSLSVSAVGSSPAAGSLFPCRSRRKG